MTTSSTDPEVSRPMPPEQNQNTATQHQGTATAGAATSTAAGTNPNAPAAANAAARLGQGLRALLHYREIGIFSVLVLLVLATSLGNDRFLGAVNLQGMELDWSSLAILAAGEAIVIITRNVDLSVGSTMGLAANVAGRLMADHPTLPAGSSARPTRSSSPSRWSWPPGSTCATCAPAGTCTRSGPTRPRRSGSGWRSGAGCSAPSSPPAPWPAWPGRSTPPGKPRSTPGSAPGWN